MSWLKRLKSGLSKSSKKISDGLTTILHHRKLDEETLEDLESLLIQSDVGAKVAAEIINKLRSEKFEAQVEPSEVKSFLAQELERKLSPYEQPLTVLQEKEEPTIILIVGVNGSGKTTTIAKLGAIWKGEGKNISFAAGDTFRAAAVQQLCIWGDRLKIPVIKKETGADAASLAYDAVEYSKRKKDDILLIDTAGRLHTNANLMEELKKVKRTISKAQEGAPHNVILVLDATIGQNAYEQIKFFDEAVGITGIIMTKLDGTAKGGVLIGLADKFKKPIYAIGVGEMSDDLQPFNAKDFSRSLVDIEEIKS